jgi:N-acetylmuramoyl-L-alanine amidase
MKRTSDGMRAIRKIIVHSSGHCGDSLRKIEERHRKRGLRRIGYHYVIAEDGRLARGRPITESGAHCLGYNSDSVGICLSGMGIPTEMQMKKLHGVVRKLTRRFPRAEIFRVGELDPWANDRLRLDTKTLKEERLS